METITFTYKTKVEQFKEQFPTLYAEIYQLGYMDATKSLTGFEEQDDNPFNCYPEYAVPRDDSKRFCLFGSWTKITDKATELENKGYRAGNRDWRDFMDNYGNWSDKTMYIAWNPTHMLFAVESDHGVINELYPDLVNAEEEELL